MLGVSKASFISKKLLTDELPSCSFEPSGLEPFESRRFLADDVYLVNTYGTRHLATAEATFYYVCR
jgi:hypothetical protein